MTRGIAVLGSTGSIGRQTLEVAGWLGIKVHALAAAGNNLELLLEQAIACRPEIIAVEDPRAAMRFREMLRGAAGDKDGMASGRAAYPARNGAAAGIGATAGIDASAGIGATAGAADPARGGSPADAEVLAGVDGLCAAASQTAAETTVAAVSGAAGLPAVIAAIKAGKAIALANKETLVTAGRIVMDLARKYAVPVLPVDSEHSAIFQCLRGQDAKSVRRLLLTASGGPFRGYDAASLENVTLEQTLAHPTFRMGKKISVDSATLMNKGLEVIEATWLFGVPPEAIEVIVHPQSIIHSMVEFRDNAVIALLGLPDMRAPIQYALAYPDRPEGLSAAADFTQIGRLTFEKPDYERFPCLALAYSALRAGGTAPAAYNAANEAAVGYFLSGAIKFTAIARLVAYAMERHAPLPDTDLGNIEAACAGARLDVENAVAGGNIIA